MILMKMLEWKKLMQSPSNIPLNWFQHTSTPEEKKKLEDLIRSNTHLLDIVRRMLYQKMETLEAAELSDANFELPEFGVRQGMYLGKKKALREVIKLFEF